MKRMIIEVATDPKHHELEIVEQQLSLFNRERAGASHYQRLILFLRDSDHHVVGGLLGETSRQWLHIETLWVHESFQRQGYGSELLKAAEQEAVRRDCRHVYLDTFSFQAPEFYQKAGYVIFGELPDFPEGYSRFFLKKDLKQKLSK